MRKLLFGTILVLFNSAAFAAQIVTRADPELDVIFDVYLTEVTGGGTVTPGAPVRLNAPLPAGASVWGATVANNNRTVVYGAVADADFDDLFVVNIASPGNAVQLNPPRAVNTMSPWGFANRAGHPAVAYYLRDTNTNTDSLWVADARVPGSADMIGPTLPTGTLIDRLLMSPDGQTLAYILEPASGPFEVWLSFASLPANGVKIDGPAPGNDLDPIEFRFSDDSTRFFWRAERDLPGNAEPILMVEIDPVARTVGPPITVNAQLETNERVFEYDFDAAGERMAYRSTGGSSLDPGDTYVVDLATPGVATKLNPPFPPGAGFTDWEDVIWWNGRVLYNMTQDNANLVQLYSVDPATPGATTRLSDAIALNPVSGSSSAPGVSHMILSRDGSRLAVVDGDPVDDIHVINPDAPGTAVQPFSLKSTQAYVATDPQNLPAPPNEGIAFSHESDLIAVRVDELDDSTVIGRNLYIGNPNQSASAVPLFDESSGFVEVIAYTWLPVRSALAAAILPTSRSGQVGAVLTAFVTLINAGTATGIDCNIRLGSDLPARLDYQITDPATNATIGAPNTPVDIAPGAFQTFVISVTLTGAFLPADAAFDFSCANTDEVTQLTGVNTLLISASANPVADVIALAATPNANGIIDLPGANGSGAFSVASVNVGASAALEVVVDTAGTTLPLTIAVCQSDPATGACINPATPTTGAVSVTINANDTPTFSVFATGGGTIADNAASNRIRLIIREPGGATRGQTSVAVRTAG